MEDLIREYNLKADPIDDMVCELRGHALDNGWSKSRLRKKRKELRILYGDTLELYNEWLIGFGRPKQMTYKNAKMILKNDIYASIVDVSDGIYLDHESEHELNKYIKLYPDKSFNRKLAKKSGYKVFLKVIAGDTPL